MSVSGGSPVTYTAVFLDLRSGCAEDEAPLLVDEPSAFLPRLLDPEGPGPSAGSLRFLLRRLRTGAAGVW